MQRVKPTSRVWRLKVLTRSNMTKHRCSHKVYSPMLICLLPPLTCSSSCHQNIKATHNRTTHQELKHLQSLKSNIVQPEVLSSNMICFNSNKHTNNTTINIISTTISSSSSRLSTKGNNHQEVNNNEISLN